LKRSLISDPNLSRKSKMVCVDARVTPERT
jgi:hypothetical protein